MSDLGKAWLSTKHNLMFTNKNVFKIFNNNEFKIERKILVQKKNKYFGFFYPSYCF